MKKRSVCVWLVLCLLFSFGGAQGEADGQALTLERLPVLQAVPYQEGLLLLSQDTLYLYQNDTVTALDGDYHVYALEEVSSADTLLYPEAYAPVPVGTSLGYLLTDDADAVYCIAQGFTGINQVSIAEHHVDMRRVCAMDHSAFVEAVDDAPILYDAVMLSNAVYFLVGDASSVFADRLLKCDLTTGAVEQIANGSFSGLCVTGAGTLLAMLSFLDASSKLVAIDAEHGEQTEVAVRLPQMAAYPREDPQTGSIYFMTDRFVYRLDHAGGSAEVYEHSGRSLLPPCFSPLLGYCIPSMDGLETKAFAEAHVTLRRQGEPDRYQQEYMRQHNTRIQTPYENEITMESLAQNMLLQEDYIDLYQLTLQSELLNFVQKGYYAPLDAPALPTATLRGFLKDVLLDDEGKLCFFPVQFSAYGLAYDAAQYEIPVPTTWRTWLEQVLALAAADEQGELALFNADYTPDYLRETLIEALLQQYGCACELVGTDAAYEELIECLRLVDNLCAHIALSNFSDDAPLFELRYPLVPAARSSTFTPMPLAFVAGELPVIMPSVTVYLLNPYSRHKEAALDYLAYIAAHQSNWLHTALYESNVPIENADYAARVQRLEDEIAEGEESLQQVDAAEKTPLEERLQQLKLDREKAEEARWDVDEASLALYLDSIPMFYFPRHQLPAALYEDDLMLLFTKQITSEEFCTRLRRIQRMWSLENQ